MQKSILVGKSGGLSFNSGTTKKACSLSLISLLTMVLISCGGSSSGGSAPTPSSNALVSIDAMTAVPVINGSSTKGVLYIHNYGNTTASGLSFGLNNETKMSKFKSLLSKAGLKQVASLGNADNFELMNPELCRSIPAGGYCAINFSTPSLTKGNKGSSLVSLDYKMNGQTYKTNQVVNYSYVDISASTGVNFTGSLNVVGAQGEARHVVGYVYGGGKTGNKYSNVVLDSSSQSTKISNGFINGIEVSSGEVIPVEFIVSLQGNKSSGVTVVPEYSNELSNERKSGTMLSLTLEPQQDIVNYIFGSVPILAAPTVSPTTINITNNGNAASTGGLTVSSDNSNLIITNNCQSTLLQANAANSCTVVFSVSTSTPGSALVTFKDNGNNTVGTQQVYWINDKPIPAVSLLPTPSTINFGKGVTQPESAISFAVINLGGAPLESVTYSITNSSPATASWTQDGSTCGVVIGSGSSCTITGHFTGVDDGAGTFYVRALGSYGGNSYSFLSLPVRYTVEAAPNLVIVADGSTSMNVLANGVATQTITYTITNDGNDPANFSALNFDITGSGQSSYFIQSGTCTSSTVLNENQNCTVIITLGPIPSSVTQNESGAGTLSIAYSGGTPVQDYSVTSTLNYTVFGNDSIAEIGTPTGDNLPGDGTESNPFSGNALLDPMTITIPYTNGSTSEPMVNFNLNTNNLPYGLKVSSNSTCATGSNLMNLAPGASCDLILEIDKDALKNSPTGGSTVLDFTEPTATWTTTFGFYEQAGNKVYVNYLQPTISFVLSENNGNFESTVLTMTASNESTATTLHGNAWSVKGWLESVPVAPSGNCTINPSDYSVSCDLKTTSTGTVTYVMPDYLISGDSADIPLVFSTNAGEFAYLNPTYTFINFINNELLVKYMFVSESSPDGTMFGTILPYSNESIGVFRADMICQQNAFDSNWVPESQQIAGSKWKALIVDGVNRSASAGAQIDWVLKANYQYRDIITNYVYGNTTSNALLSFPLTTQFGYSTTSAYYSNWIQGGYSPLMLWTGLDITDDGAWTTGNNCSLWSSTSPHGRTGSTSISAQIYEAGKSSLSDNDSDYSCDNKDYTINDEAQRILCVQQ